MDDANIPERNGRPWRFCGKCGGSMEWRQYAMAYDRESGKYGPTWVWVCPHHVGGTGTATHDRSNVVVHDRVREVIEQ